MAEWWRSWHGAPTDIKWRAVAKRAGVPTHLVVAVAWALLDRASQAVDRGSIEGFDPEDLAVFLDCETQSVCDILEALRGKGIVTENARIAAWQVRQPIREGNLSTSRVKAWRQREKAASQSDETHMKRNETQGNSREEKRRGDKKEKKGYATQICAAENLSHSGRGKRLPADWRLPESWGAWAIAQGMAEPAVRAESARFADYWHAVAGRGATKLDWFATWRNWIRQTIERAAVKPARPVPVSVFGGEVERE